MLYFKGCTAGEKMTSLCDSTEEILKKAGIDYRTIENEECCGSVLLRTGFKDEA
ncbi:MAG: heterodisulfide reductase-related iron-sulfur binding cluster, partial [Methanobacteriaceae archaeon]